MLRRFFDKIFEEVLFSVLLVLLVGLSFFSSPDFTAIDWRVIAALMNLMLIAIAFEELYFLDALAIRIVGRFHTERHLAFALIGISMVMAMWMTNDVALLTLVPLTLLIGKKGHFNPYKLVALETVAANVGSSLTPFGNPQNIYLFNVFNISILDFFEMSALFVLPATLVLFLIASRCSKSKIPFTIGEPKVESKGKLYLYSLLFLLVILSILHLVNWQVITALVLVTTLILDRTHFLKLDYFLLGTFCLFFMVVSQLTSFIWLKAALVPLLQNPLSVLWSSAILSQLISNVPSAILLSPFVQDVQPLLLGVSLGGMGTLIASLANLIAYRLYAKEYPSAIYQSYFTRINGVSLLIVGAFLSILLAVWR